MTTGVPESPHNSILAPDRDNRYARCIPRHIIADLWQGRRRTEWQGYMSEKLHLRVKPVGAAVIFCRLVPDILPEVRRATVDMLKDPIYDIEIRKKAAHNALQYPVNPTELISGYAAQVSS